MLPFHGLSSSRQAEKMAAKEIEFEMVSRETIKPSSPMREEADGTLKLSLIDQLFPDLYVSVLLFYSGEGEATDNDVQAQLAADKSKRLKSSLTNVLTRYFPLAGKIRDNFWIDCNDQGAVYIETKVGCRLIDVLAMPNPSVLNRLFPVNTESPEDASELLVLVKASFFECGGLAIGISLSHRICDGSSLSSFVKAWTGMARGSTEVPSPNFTVASSLIPPQENMAKITVPESTKEQVVIRRYVFDASSIAALRARTATAVVPEPSRVDAVSCLMWKCVANATGMNSGSAQPSRRSALSTFVNLRKRFTPPLPEHSIGNISGTFQAVNDDPEAELDSLVSNLKANFKDYLETYPKTLQKDQYSAVQAVFEVVQKYASLTFDQGLDFFSCSSWCGFGFYDADFGWGKPIWAAIDSSVLFKNNMVLFETRDRDGVEVWLSMASSDMARLDHDPELLKFAVMNPSINW